MLVTIAFAPRPHPIPPLPIERERPRIDLWPVRLHTPREHTAAHNKQQFVLSLSPGPLRKELRPLFPATLRGHCSPKPLCVNHALYLFKHPRLKRELTCGICAVEIPFCPSSFFDRISKCVGRIRVSFLTLADKLTLLAHAPHKTRAPTARESAFHDYVVVWNPRKSRD